MHFTFNNVFLNLHRFKWRFKYFIICFSLLIYSYFGDTPMAQNLRLEYALPVNKEFSVSVGKVLLNKYYPLPR
jgi:hypothetical protein